MNPELLLAHFDRISDASDAIPRIRRFVLDLAVRGKLVEQDPIDEPASELVREIQADKHHLVMPSTKLAGKPLPPISRNEIPYELPRGWEWARLGLLGETNIGLTYSPQDVSDDGIPVLRSNNIRDGKLVLSDVVRVDTNVKESALVSEGDLLICARNGSRALVGKAAIITELEETTAFGAFMAIFRSRVNRYIYHFICSPLFRLMIAEVNTTTINQLTQSNLRSTLIPVPPLLEQHRIVAKVEELLILCDRLEAAKAERESRHNTLAAASHHHLSNGTDNETFRNHARFYLGHVPCLTASPAHIRQLRQTILNLAVRGQLVSQDSDDEPAVALLAQNDQQRRMVAKEDRRADVDRQVPLATESRWSIPRSWDWCALADLVLFIDYRGKTPTKTEQGARLITAKNVKRGFINTFPEEFISEASYRTWMTRGFPKEGDILFTTEAPLGNAAVVRLPERFALAQRVICFRSYGSVNPEFLTLQLLSEPFQSILNKTATGLTAKGIKAAKLKRLPVAIPPLGEQHRIVAKVDEVMALCDGLESKLNATQTETQRLLGAVLHQALTATA